MKEFLVICLILSISGNVFSADVILNEYNAVADTEFLNDGNISSDVDRNRASDTYFGRVLGNGGDWFELVVITDHLDMRRWELVISTGGSDSETLVLTNHSIWSNLRSGTIITVSEDVPSDISYDPAGGDWWINVQANNTGDGLYIDTSNFPVNNNDWQLEIKNADGIATIFGPAGEGVYPIDEVSDHEVFRLEADPSAAIAGTSTEYDDGRDFSTFGSPNQWGLQEFTLLRTVVDPAVASLTVYTPDGTEVIMGGTTYEITWGNTGSIDSVLIEYSIDYGNTWTEVYPPNVGNTGSYNWLVPDIDSQLCTVRIASSTDFNVYDISHTLFSVYQCPLEGDLTGDCIIDLADVSVMASEWLQCGNPSCL